MRGTMVRGFTRWAVASAMVLSAVAVWVADGSAAPVSYATTPITTGWSTNGTVLKVLVVGDTVYVGGTFTAVRPSAGGPAVSRSNLAAFDVHTGALHTGFAAGTNDAVRALASDGSRLFVGGSFTTVNGATRPRLAAVDLVSGSTISGFTASPSSHVFDLHVDGDRLYVGGSFGAVNGTARNRVAAVSTATGAVDPAFRPDANHHVRAIATSPDGSVVYLGGQFSAVGGGDRRYLAPVSASTGALLPLVFQYSHYGQALELDVSPDGSQVVAALADLENSAIAWDTTTGRRMWVQTADGDTQTVRFHEGNVYFGFHEGFGDDTTVRVLAADAATGQLDADFRPTVNSFYGVWTIDGHRDALVIGGEFTRFDGVATQGIAILPRLGSSPPPDDPPPDDPPPAGDPTSATLIARGSVWRYTEDGIDRGTAWTGVGYDDSTWPSGAGQLGYGDGDEATVVFRGGATTASRHLSHYFRSAFTVADASAVTALTLDLLRDDGAAVYLNGVEVLRDNLPGGTITATTYATAGVWGADESAYTAHVLPVGLLVDGTNVLAVSVHNESRSSSDLSFDASLVATVSTTPPPDDPPPPPPDDPPPPPPPPPADPVDTTAIARGSVWRYTEDGIDRGTAWKDVGYDDSAWPSGAGQLGYGEGDEATVIARGGPDVASRHLGHYFRTTFAVDDASAVLALTLDLLRDDGAVVYLNGVEVLRENMPAGTITLGTYPTAGVWGAAESAYTAHSLPLGLLVDGTNVLAVSVHNESRSSSDLSFDASLVVRHQP